MLRPKRPEPELRYQRVSLKPLWVLDNIAWKKVHRHFKDKEIAYLNGTPPTRMPLWMLRRILKTDAKRPDRLTYGIFDDAVANYIGTIELYDLGYTSATLGIIIGEKEYWGRGFGSEAIHALLDYAFGRLHLEKVRLHTFEDNLRARASFRNIGFVETMRRRNHKGRVNIFMEMHASTWQKLSEQPPVWHVNAR